MVLLLDVPHPIHTKGGPTISSVIDMVMSYAVQYNKFTI